MVCIRQCFPHHIDRTLRDQQMLHLRNVGILLAFRHQNHKRFRFLCILDTLLLNAHRYILGRGVRPCLGIDCKSPLILPRSFVPTLF